MIWLCTKPFPLATVEGMNVTLVIPFESVMLLDALKTPLPLATVQLTVAPGTGLLALSVTCTVIGSKTVKVFAGATPLIKQGGEGAINCPFPETTAIFCANNACPAKNTINVNFFKGSLP